MNNAVRIIVFISPVYTKLEKHDQYNLRVEQPRRAAAGESNLIIRNGAVVTRRILTAGEAIAPVAASPAVTSI